MSSSMPRYIKMDDWIFEIKAVRALKVPKYGEPYKAISNLSVMGESMYIDGQMAREDDKFTRKDFSTFYKFCQTLGMKTAHFDRIQDGERVTRIVDIEPPKEPEPFIRLVK
ncbi:hypothetical protein EYS14_18955 [Alteromonadaceae bacterium M269]|nr:hypothetical protein EYS14_18955 [Alteromonadaceae bacterium M269]